MRRRFFWSMVGVAGLTLVLLVVLAAVVTQRAQENAAELLAKRGYSPSAVEACHRFFNGKNNFCELGLGIYLHLHGCKDSVRSFL